MVYLTLWRVDVLHLHVLSSRIKHTTAESHYFTRQRMHREDDTPPKTVAQCTIVFTITQSGLLQELRLITFLYSSTCQRITIICAISQLELLDNVITEATASQISHTYALTFFYIIKYVLKVFRSKLIDHEKTLAKIARLLFFFGQLTLFYFDIIFTSQPLQSFIIRKLLVLHNEVHHISTLSATETFA